MKKFVREVTKVKLMKANDSVQEIVMTKDPSEECSKEEKTCSCKNKKKKKKESK